MAVHTDKEHIHAHIIWNSVSYLDGKMYHAPKGHYLEKVRHQCDEQCKAYGLSVIPPKESHSDPEYDPDLDRIARQPVAAYWDDQKGKVTRRTQLKLDIEQAIASPNVLTIGQFYSDLLDRQDTAFPDAFHSHLSVWYWYLLLILCSFDSQQLFIK